MTGWPSLSPFPGAGTSSTRVLVNAPPDTRKLAYGWVTRNGTDVSVPFRAAPPVLLLTQ